MKIYFKKPDKDKFSSTFPAMEAELDDKVIKGLKMDRALRRFARQLYEQYKKTETRDNKSRPIGIEVHGLTFSILLGGKEK